MSDVAARLSSALANRYRVERELGAGGMATVYLAHDLKHDRQVAIKVLKPELAAVLGAERFLSEIKVTANLQHPNLLPLFDSGSADGLLYYVMPYLEGETLRARMQRERQLPVDETLRLVSLLAGALDLAHSRGVIHRDLKPENILLQAGQPVIADFGIALAVAQAGGERVTQTGISLGTPHYMSPEQAAGDRAVDARSDQYALGAIAYEMLTGEPPHTGATAQVIIARLMTDTPRSITSARPAVPKGIDIDVLRALSKTPADRFPTCGDFARAVTSHVAAGPTPRQSWVPLTVGLLAAALVITAGVAWPRKAPAADANLSSIAVLPFADRSANASDAHLGDGIAETLISALAKVPELEVAARTSAFSFRGKEDNLAEIGRKLGVATVLEGSVQRAGDRIRVTSELVNVGTGRTMWSQTFDRAAGEIFAVQDDVAREVIAALKGRLLAEQTAVHTGNATRDPEAYDLYLRGRYFWRLDVRAGVGLPRRRVARPGVLERRGRDRTAARSCRRGARRGAQSHSGRGAFHAGLPADGPGLELERIGQRVSRGPRAQPAICQRLEVVLRPAGGGGARRRVARPHHPGARSGPAVADHLLQSRIYPPDGRPIRRGARVVREGDRAGSGPSRRPRLGVARVPDARRHGEVLRGARATGRGVGDRRRAGRRTAACLCNEWTCRDLARTTGRNVHARHAVRARHVVCRAGRDR